MALAPPLPQERSRRLPPRVDTGSSRTADAICRANGASARMPRRTAVERRDPRVRCRPLGRSRAERQRAASAWAAYAVVGESARVRPTSRRSRRGFLGSGSDDRLLDDQRRCGMATPFQAERPAGGAIRTIKSVRTRIPRRIGVREPAVGGSGVDRRAVRATSSRGALSRDRKPVRVIPVRYRRRHVLGRDRSAPLAGPAACFCTPRASGSGAPTLASEPEDPPRRSTSDRPLRQRSRALVPAGDGERFWRSISW
jgi:hypothetical protein